MWSAIEQEAADFLRDALKIKPLGLIPVFMPARNMAVQGVPSEAKIVLTWCEGNEFFVDKINFDGIWLYFSPEVKATVSNKEIILRGGLLDVK